MRIFDDMFLSKVRKYISDNKLLAEKAVVVVGFSGGADSMALLNALRLLDYQCIAAHCNFHLRGNESDEDARFAANWCMQNNMTYVSTDFDTEKYAAENKISIEMAARDLRYNWFETIREKFNAEAIAVAHHKDDSVETVLLNLTRGTGISGLRGIRPKNGKIVRPLLCVNREEIEEYLKLQNLPYRFDSTNAEDIYVRNFLRLNILPALETINPSVKEAIFRTSENMAEVEKVYHASIQTDIAKVVADNIIDINRLQEMVSPHAVLYEYLTKYGFSPSTIENVYHGLNAESGKQYFSKTHRLIKDREALILDEIKEENDFVFEIHSKTQNVVSPIELEIYKTDVSEKVIKDPNILYVDADKITFPLVVRKWKSGDWFIPFGMKGRKKVSDFFSDQKLNLKQKEEAWLLFSGEKLVWIIGYRNDDRFKIDTSTKNVIKLVYKKTECRKM